MLFERKLLIFVTAALSGLGLLMVYSASITARPSFADQKYLTRQLLFLVVGVCAAAVASRLPSEFWRKSAVPFAVVTGLLLVAVLVPGIGSRINGAQRWFRFASMSVQPSELAKLSLVLFLGWAVERKGERIRRFWTGWAPLMVIPAAFSILVLVEPDFGTAVFLLSIAAMMLFLAGVPILHMIMIAATIVPVFTVLVITQPYRMKRIFEFVQGWSDPSVAPYQVRQSLVALGAGSIWGSGLGQGWQKLGFLPEANTDFVFAIVGEELGLAGTITVLVLWTIFLICGVRLAWGARHDRFIYLTALGLVCQSVLQAVVNIGVVTGTLPPKGISLPFLSAGGSNLIVSLVSVGVLLGMTRAARGAGNILEAAPDAKRLRVAGSMTRVSWPRGADSSTPCGS
jgi:cell division protein FtsW